MSGSSAYLADKTRRLFAPLRHWNCSPASDAYPGFRIPCPWERRSADPPDVWVRPRRFALDRRLTDSRRRTGACLRAIPECCPRPGFALTSGMPSLTSFRGCPCSDWPSYNYPRASISASATRASPRLRHQRGRPAADVVASAAAVAARAAHDATSPSGPARAPAARRRMRSMPIADKAAH